MKRGQSLDDSRTIGSHGAQDDTLGLVRASTRGSGRARQSHLAGFCLNTAVRFGDCGGDGRNLTRSTSTTAGTSSAQVADSGGGDTSSNGLTIRSESAEDCGYFARCLFTVSAALCGLLLTKMGKGNVIAGDEELTAAESVKTAVTVVDAPLTREPDALPVLLAPPFPPPELV